MVCIRLCCDHNVTVSAGGVVAVETGGGWRKLTLTLVTSLLLLHSVSLRLPDTAGAISSGAQWALW